MKNTVTSLKELIVSITCAIDLMSFLVKNHHQRVAIISYELGKAMHLKPRDLNNLVLAASLHDIGATSIKVRNDLIKMDVENPEEHAELGARMLGTFPYFDGITNIIKHHHAHWNNGAGTHIDGEKVPVECFILHLADRIDILIDPDRWILDEKELVREKIKEYRGTLFYPEVVDKFLEISANDNFWLNLNYINLETLLNSVLIDEERMILDADMFQLFAMTLSNISDYRSKYTVGHSVGVSEVAYELAGLAGLNENTRKDLRIAGLLHDFGKIAIPQEVLDKKGELTEGEFNIIRAHSYYTGKILSNISGISEISKWTLLHHERCDGSGYPFGLKDNEIDKNVSVLILADIFTALREDRSYRDAINLDEAMEIIRFRINAHPTNDNINELIEIVKNNSISLDNIREIKQKEAVDYFMS